MVRQERIHSWLHSLFSDCRFAFRMLRKSPGFTAVAVLTLALGIGANTAIFSLIDAVLLRSHPVREPHRLVVFQWTAHNSPNLKGHYNYMSCPAANAGATGEHGCWFSYPMFQQFHSKQDAFSTVAALCGNVGLNLRGNGPASFVQGEMVSGDFFETLGVGPSLGRTLNPSDDTPGAPPVAILSYRFWQSTFGADPAVVGRTVWLNNVPVTIAGVAAKEFPGLDPGNARAIWLPLSISSQVGMDLFGSVSGDHPSLQAGDDIWWIYIVARLKEGISSGQAQAAAGALFYDSVLDKSKELFKVNDAPRLVLLPAPQAISGLREQFSTPLAILMTAVGMVLFVACANVAGLMLARSATRQRELAVRLALGAGRARITRQLLKESPAALATAASRSRFLSLGGALVIAQVALAILVLSGAGLLVRTLQNLKSINPGFDTRNLLLFRMDPSLNGYKGPRSKSLYSELLARIQAISGVLSATYSFVDLLSGNSWNTSFGIEGEVENTSHATLGLNAGPKFFETMGIPLMAGRAFTPQDFSLPPDTKWEPAVINQAFARTFFKDRNPLGRRLTGVGHQGSSGEIVGIVGDTKFRSLRSEIAPTLFVPAGGGEAVFEIRTAVDPRSIIPAVRSVVSQLDNNLPLFSMKTESEQIERSLFQERLIACLSSFFGALSLLLACVGLYGLLSYEVTQRTREIGIRMALGARPPDVLRIVVLQGVGLSVVGAIIGILVALGATRYLASLLYGVRPFDPPTFLSVVLLLSLVALAACYIPARRASRVDPLVALRYE